MDTNSNNEVNTSKSSSDLSTRVKQNNLKLTTETQQWRLNQEAKKREKQLAKDKIAEEEGKKAEWRKKLNTESHPWLSEGLSYDKRKEISNKIINDINHGIDVYSEDYLKVTPSTEDPQKVKSSTEDAQKVTSSNEIKQESVQEKKPFSYKYKTDQGTYNISNSEVDAMEAAYKGHASTLKGRKQKDYIEGYTQILNALREGKSPSASSQTYSGQHFWSFMDQLKPEQGEDKTTLDTTPESKYNLHGLLTRDVYHGDYSALEKDFSTPFVRTDQNKLDLDVRLDNVYNAAKNLGYTGEKTEEGLKEYLVRGNHLNSDQFNRYLGIGSTTSSESSPIKLPEGYNIVDNGNFFNQNTLLVKNPNGEKEILQNINGQWVKVGIQAGFRVANDKFSLYVDDYGAIQLTPLESDPTTIKEKEALAKSDNAPITREVEPMKYNYILESLGIKGNNTVLDISDGFDGIQEGIRLVIDSLAGSADGDFNNRPAQLYSSQSGNVINGTIGKTADGKWALFTPKDEQGERKAYPLGNYYPDKTGSTDQTWIGNAEYTNPIESLEGSMEFQNALKKDAQLDRGVLMAYSTRLKDDPKFEKTFPSTRGSTVSENVYTSVVKRDKKLQENLLSLFSRVDENNLSKHDQILARALYKLYNKGILPIPPAQKGDFLNKVYRILAGKDFGQQTQTATKKQGGIIKALTGAEVVASMRRKEAIKYTPSEKPQPVTYPTAIWNKDNKEARIGSQDEFAKEWDGHDVATAAALTADAVAVVSSFIPGVGTAVALTAGLIGTAIDAVNNFTDDDVDSSTAWKNLGLNLGLTAVGMIPGARFAKLAKSTKEASKLTDAAKTAINAAKKQKMWPKGLKVTSNEVQKALNSADDMLKHEGIIEDAIKGIGGATKYIQGIGKVANAGMMTVGTVYGVSSAVGAAQDISKGDGISLEQIRGIIAGTAGLRGLKWKFIDKPALKAVTKSIGTPNVIRDVPLKKQKFTLVKGKGKTAIKETVEIDYKPGMTPDEVKVAAKLKLQEEGLKLAGVDEARFNKMAELETSDFEIKNADSFFKQGSQKIYDGLGSAKSKTARLFTTDADLNNLEIKNDQELFSSGFGILEKHGLNVAKQYGIAPKTSIDAYKQNLKTRVPQFQQEEYNKRFMEELGRIRVNKQGGIIKGQKGIDYVTKVADQKPWDNRTEYNGELLGYYSKTDKDLEEFNKFFDEYHNLMSESKYMPGSGIAIKHPKAKGYQNKFVDMGFALDSFIKDWAPLSKNPLNTGDRWVNGIWNGGDEWAGEGTHEKAGNLFNEEELVKQQEAIKDKGWEWYEDTTHEGRDGRKFYYLRTIPTKEKTPPEETTTTDTTVLKIPTTPGGKKSGIDITAITELPELIGSRLTNKRNYETMMKVTPALPQTYSWYEAVKNNLPYEQLSRKSAASQLNQAEKQAMNIADPARRQAIMQEASARSQEITDRAAIANQEMYAQTKGQQEQNALKETAMHTDNANQINSILHAHKLSQAQLEAGQRTADHESLTRYLNRIKQNADLIQKSKALEQDKDAQRNAELEMQKIDKSLNLKYPNIDEEVVKAKLEKDVKEAQLREPNLNITEESIKPGTGGKKYIEYYKELYENQKKAYEEEYGKALEIVKNNFNLNKSNYIHPNWVPFSTKSNKTPSTERVITPVDKKAKGGQLTYAERAALVKLKASYKQMSDETKNIQKSIDRGQRQVERILDGLSKERYMVVKHMLSK